MEECRPPKKVTGWASIMSPIACMRAGPSLQITKVTAGRAVWDHSQMTNLLDVKSHCLTHFFTSFINIWPFGAHYFHGVRNQCHKFSSLYSEGSRILQKAIYISLKPLSYFQMTVSLHARRVRGRGKTWLTRERRASQAILPDRQIYKTILGGSM